MGGLPPPSVDTLAVKISEVEKRLDAKISEMDKRLDERFAAQDKAEGIADRTLTAWQHAHNDTFSALSRSYSEKMAREEYQVQHQALIEKVDKMEETLRIQIGAVDRRIGLTEGRLMAVEGKATGVQASLGWVFSAIALAISLYALLSGHAVAVLH